MSPLLAAEFSALLVGLLVIAWFLGKWLEEFLASKYCWPITRRVIFTTAALAVLRGAIEVFWRVTQ